MGGDTLRVSHAVGLLEMMEVEIRRASICDQVLGREKGVYLDGLLASVLPSLGNGRRLAKTRGRRMRLFKGGTSPEVIVAPCGAVCGGLEVFVGAMEGKERGGQDEDEERGN
ncbi:hypothetical protein HAX54_052833 [Datura stramonium]|uniref:Uncharacterized protein n=1 Tax=Datura stramonium TaxID=4076 RepID=A0ABS8WR50_DATST|nr:hypothetical protein [Datura stramonium]